MAHAAQTKPDYYNILGVSRHSSVREIEAAFHKLAAVFHAAGKPKNIDDVEEIRRYVTAYRVLSDPEKRAYYDRTGFHPLEIKLVASDERINDSRKKFDAVLAAIDIGFGLLDLFS
jgi:DnaJ-class molecular chaperone